MTYGKKMKEICTQLGVDVDSLPDKLYSTLLDAIAENAGSGGEITLDNINITENGTYTAATGHAYKKAVVDVPQEEPTLVEKSITENGTYTAASEEADGFSQVVVNVEQGITPSGSISITENGTYDVTDKASAVVNVSGGEMPDEYAIGGSLADGSCTGYHFAPTITTILPNTYLTIYNVAEIDIPQTVTSINSGALNYGNASKTTKITVNSSQCTISANVFGMSSSSSNLHRTYYFPNATFTESGGVIVPSITIDASTFRRNGGYVDGMLFATQEIANAYKSATNWSAWADYIGVIE